MIIQNLDLFTLWVQRTISPVWVFFLARRDDCVVDMNMNMNLINQCKWLCAAQ